MPVIALIFAPFWMLDATLIRPGLLCRVGWTVVIPVELAMAILSVVALSAASHDRFVSIGSWSMLHRALPLTLLFYSLYLAFSIILFRWGPLKVWRR